MSIWTCQRQSFGVKCGEKNDGRKRKCGMCGKPRPTRRKPSHLAALELPYEEFVLINGGDHCGICGRGPSEVRRLDRDHDHKTGLGRGLLCHRCNRALAGWMTVDWLRAAIAYLERGGEA